MAKHNVGRYPCRSSWIPQKLAFVLLGMFVLSAMLLTCGCNSERPLTEPEAHSENGTVVLGGHLSRDIVEEGEALRFWITVENRTSTPLENVRITELDTPGFKKIRWCWGPSVAAKGCANRPDAKLQVLDPDCAAASGRESSSADEWLLCQSLKPGESLVVWGDLSVDDPYLPPERLYAVVSWTATPSHPTSVSGRASTEATGRKDSIPEDTKPAMEASSRVFPLGTAEPVSALHSLTWLTKPEISIPAALAILGLCLTWLAARRDERSKVFTAMLGAVHDSAIHYFMPMCSTLSAAMLYIRKAREDASPGENARWGFYYLTMFHWWQRRVLNKVGAYQLRSRTGEKLLLALSGKHRELYPRSTEAAWRRLDAILSDLQKETTLDEFLGTLDGGDSDWAGAWSDFAGWVKTDNCKNDLDFLDSFTQVMLYEVNGLHELWYGTRSPMKLTEDTRKAIMAVATGDFRFEVQNYLQVAEDSDTTLRTWN
jgi:hypothetical protein